MCFTSYYLLVAFSALWMTGTMCVMYDFQSEVYTVTVDRADGQYVYVGGNNVVFKLSPDLRLLKTSQRLMPGDVDNPVRVVRVDPVFRWLLVCDTVSDGQCSFLHLDDLSQDRFLSQPSGRVHVDPQQRPIVAHVPVPRSRTQPAFSRWIVSSPNSVGEGATQSKPIMSVREIHHQGDAYAMRYGGNGKSVIRKYNPSFHFDILDGFCVDEFCLYLTLQQSNASSAKLVSRVAGVCASSLFPYVEIRFDGTQGMKPDYDRAVAFTLGQIGLVRQASGVSLEDRAQFVIAVFEEGATNHTAGGFVLRYAKLQTIKNWLELTRKICAIPFPGKIQAPDWFRGTYKNCTKEDFHEDQCSRQKTYLNPVIQDSKENALQYSISVPPGAGQAMGHVTSVFTHTQLLRQEASNGTERLDDYMTIFVTTTGGRVYKFHSQIGRNNELEIKRLPDTPTDVTGGVRRDLAVTQDHFYLLGPAKVVRVPLDYCRAIGSYDECRRLTQGCAWCPSSNTCSLKAKCPGNDSSQFHLHVYQISPSSGPVAGGTVLTLTGRGFVRTATVTVCGQPCRILDTERSRERLMCEVPASVNGSEDSCVVSVTISYTLTNSTSYLHTNSTSNFTYTVPEVHDITPGKMLFSERGHLVFPGMHLDTGSNATVSLVTAWENITCPVIHRQWDELSCDLPAATNVRNANKECYNVHMAFDNYFLSLEKWKFCRFPDPVISDTDPMWTFKGGEMPLTVTGVNLDLVEVRLRLTIHGFQIASSKCSECSNMTAGSCLVCCSPDVTNFTDVSVDGVTPVTFRNVTIPAASNGDVTAEVTFDVRGKQSQMVVVVNYSKSITVRPDPVFSFVESASASPCLKVTSSDAFEIKGSFLPISFRYFLQIGMRTVCTDSHFAEDSATLTCDLRLIQSDFLSDGNDNKTSRAMRKPVVEKARQCSTRTVHEDAEGKEKSNKRPVEVFVGGRLFPVGCVEVVTARADGEGFSFVVLGVVVGAVVLVTVAVLVAVVCCRRGARKPYLPQHSVTSGRLLVHSDSGGGSGEAVYVSVQRVLNPTGSRTKQAEIEQSGLLIPRTRLNLGNVIGQGNFGCVFEGHYQADVKDDDSWQMVAVKTLLDPNIHAIDIKGFIDEAMLMKTFSHPHVLGLLGLSEGDRGPLVVLPYMQGGDLLTHVKDHSTVLTIGSVLRFAVDIASGMDYLASNKFVHRDLAARNCMLDDELRVKVADFGLCRDVYEKGYYHSDNKKKLPIRWMALESIEKGHYTPKSDVWSMGVVVWEMTTRGITPYAGVEGWDILRYLESGRRLDQPLLCPDPLYALMERCWRAEPLDRPFFHDLHRDLESLTQALQSPAVPNALCVHTVLASPQCHRFKDDGAIVEKVKAAMLKMSLGAASTLTGSPELSPISHDTSTGSVFSAESTGGGRPPAAAAGGSQFAFPYTGPARGVSGHGEVNETGRGDAEQDIGSCQDDGYFQLEQNASLPAAASLTMTPLRQTEVKGRGDGADSVVSWRGKSTEMQHVTGKDDGYFELEQEESSRL